MSYTPLLGVYGQAINRYWCDDQPCESQEKVAFDYHQTSKFYTRYGLMECVRSLSSLTNLSDECAAVVSTVSTNRMCQGKVMVAEEDLRQYQHITL